MWHDHWAQSVHIIHACLSPCGKGNSHLLMDELHCEKKKRKKKKTHLHAWWQPQQIPPLNFLGYKTTKTIKTYRSHSKKRPGYFHESFWVSTFVSIFLQRSFLKGSVVSTQLLFLNLNFRLVHHSKLECVLFHYQHKSFTLGKLFQYNLLN